MPFFPLSALMRTMSIDASPDAETVSKANAANPNVEIRQSPDQRGWGVFARRSFPKGEALFRGRSLESNDMPTSHSIQTDWDTHVMMDLPAILSNHSCGANAGVQPNDLGAYDFYAMKDIAKDEEIFWDYETSEYEVSTPFVCNCGDPECRGKMQGFRFHGDALVDKYGLPFIAPYLLDGEANETEKAL